MARIRDKETVLENSPVGDSKANGVAERAVQAFGEQFRVIREGLQQRLQVRIPGNHPLTSWMTEHSADLLNKYQCGEDGRTAYRRWKGKDFQGQVVEFGEKDAPQKPCQGREYTEQDGRALARELLFGHGLEDRVGMDWNIGWSHQGERDPQDGSTSKVGPRRSVGCARHPLEQGASCGGRTP